MPRNSTIQNNQEVKGTPYKFLSFVLWVSLILVFWFYNITTVLWDKPDNEKIQSLNCSIFDSYSWVETKQIFINLLYHSNWNDKDGRALYELNETLKNIKDWEVFEKCWTVGWSKYEIYSNNGVRRVIKEELAQSFVKYLVSPDEAIYRLNDMLSRNRIRLGESMTAREVWIYKELEYRFDKIDWRIEITKIENSIE